MDRAHPTHLPPSIFFVETYHRHGQNTEIIIQFQFNSIQLYFQTNLYISYAQYRGPE